MTPISVLIVRAALALSLFAPTIALFAARPSWALAIIGGGFAALLCYRAYKLEKALLYVGSAAELADRIHRDNERWEAGRQAGLYQAAERERRAGEWKS